MRNNKKLMIIEKRKRKRISKEINKTNSNLTTEKKKVNEKTKKK